MAATTKRPPWAFFLHSLIGVKLSFFLGFVCLTGTIATVSHEIEWLLMPEVRATAGNGEPPHYGAMWDAAREAFPNARLSGINSYDRNDEAYFVKTVAATDAAGRDADILVDPGTNRVTGVMRGTSFHSFMRALHYYLFAPTIVPQLLVSALGFVLVLSLITGLFAYKKFWRSLLRRPRWHAAPRALMGDLHRLTGLWSLWFVAVIGLTCVYYFAEFAGLDLNRPTPVAAAPLQQDLRPDGAKIDRWVALATARMPDLQVTGLSLPYEPGDPVIVQGQWQAWVVRERTNAVFIDPANDRVIGARVAHNMGAGERLVHTVDPLHFGNFGGLVSKLIWVVFGLLLTGLAFSGAFIFAKRTRQAARQTGVLRPLDYLGRWKWPSVTVAAVVPLVSFFFLWGV